MAKQFKRRMRRNYVGKRVLIERHEDHPALTGEVIEQELMLEVRTEHGNMVRVPVSRVTLMHSEEGGK